MREVLGTGEVDARIDALGLTRVRETAVGGVWWVTHRSRAGEILAEFLEVTLVPEILCAQSAEIGPTLDALAARLAAAGDQCALPPLDEAESRHA